MPQRRKCFDAFEGTGVPTVPLRSLISGNSDDYWNPRTMHVYEVDPLFKKYVVLSKGAIWKSTRACMMRFFTPSKLKAVMPSLLHAEQQFIDILGEHADSGVEVDINSLCERFTFDVIGKAAFGMDTNVQRNPEMSMFRVALDVLPNLNSGFLYNLGRLQDRVEYLSAGALEFALPPYSAPLQEPGKGSACRKGYAGHESSIVVTEKMFTRFTTRCADEDYLYGKYLIKKGTSVMVPTFQLHHDPKYWENPEKFIPERFSPEKKDRINPIVYQPFGLGPRICLGQRLAQVELASATTHILRHYRIMLGTSQKGAPPHQPSPPLRPAHTEPAVVAPAPKAAVAQATPLLPTETGDSRVFGSQGLPSPGEAKSELTARTFSPENKDRINPTVYQPFGLGPRICLGQRLAQVELASTTTHILRHYRIMLGTSQKEDLEFDTYSYLVVPKEAVKIRLHRLSTKK
ncbi:hypothetical protein HPB51_001376 [Rhipicephalus microplus]|uniref:Cytochrome n=1 Tax=Rhipicephalus microplus TaxID=6941 RepID=A0A9J6ER15_RHIMP|nr:hypothetical protein HPB51_001376 [Rhipicephalus microplus]